MAKNRVVLGNTNDHHLVIGYITDGKLTEFALADREGKNEVKIDDFDYWCDEAKWLVGQGEWTATQEELDKAGLIRG